MSELPYRWIIPSFDEVFDFKGGTQPPKDMFSDIHLAGFVRILQIRDYDSDDKAEYIRDETR
jgi:type I restriction enzyme S subunit